MNDDAEEREATKIAVRFARDVCKLAQARHIDGGLMFSAIGMALTAVIGGLDDEAERHRIAFYFASTLLKQFPGGGNERLH